MKYQPDNLTPKQKKNAYIGILILSLFFASFFGYKFFLNKERKKFLSKNTATTICKIIRTNSYKSKTNTVKYEVYNKKYTYESLSGRIFQIGELFNLKYSIENPNISEVIYTQPIIIKKDDYEETTGKVISLYANSRVNIIKFKYNYNEKEYERDLYVEDITEFKENNKYRILVNKQKPKISYLKSLIKISH
jgi:hypothetical protein